MPQADRTHTPARAQIEGAKRAAALNADPFGCGGWATPDVSVADYRLFYHALMSAWAAGSSDKWTTFVVTVPKQFADRLSEVVDRDLFSDLDPICPSSVEDEAEELTILWDALRRRERMFGYLEAAEKEACGRASELRAARMRFREEV